MEFRDVIKRVEESEPFKEFLKTHPKAYLAHVFVMVDEANEGVYQVGYYDAEKERITTFMVTPEDIKAMPEAEVLRQPNTELQELKAEEIQLSGQDALDKAQEFKEEEYEGKPVLKLFYIVQCIDNEPVFNITYVLRDFNTLNIKISTRTGEVLKHSLASLVDMQEGNRNAH